MAARAPVAADLTWAGVSSSVAANGEEATCRQITTRMDDSCWALAEGAQGIFFASVRLCARPLLRTRTGKWMDDSDQAHANGDKVM